MELPSTFSWARWRATLIPVDLYYLVHMAKKLGYHPQAIPIFSQKFASKKCPPGGGFLTPPPEGAAEGLTVFDQTFVKSLRVRNALRAGLQFLVAKMMIRGLNEAGKAQQKRVTVFECGASAKPSNFCEKFASEKCPPGGVSSF